MSIIACVLPDASLIEPTRLAFQNRHDDIRITVGLMEKGISQAAKLAQEGYEIFISRGMTASLIRKNANPEWSVVAIPFTVLDVFQTIERAKLHGKSIGVIAFAP